VCTEPPYAPFESIDPDGDVVGLDMDIVARIAAAIGPDVKVEPIVSSFESLESGIALDSETCDLAASALTITPERQEKFDFSNPYFEVDLAVFSKDPAITDVESLRGKTLSAQIGTPGLEWANSNGFPVKEFRDLELQVQAVMSGDVDATIQDDIVLVPYVKEPYSINFRIPTGDRFGIGVKKGNTALLGIVNTVLAEIEADGSYAAMYEQWIGGPPPAKAP
jgi:polar amino acid transport system substrate-binding protein